MRPWRQAVPWRFGSVHLGSSPGPETQRKKPTWPNTSGCPSTSAYSSTGRPKRAAPHLVVRQSRLKFLAEPMSSIALCSASNLQYSAHEGGKQGYAEEIPFGWCASGSARLCHRRKELVVMGMQKTRKKSEARTQQEMERLLADVANNERELRNERAKPGRGKGKKTGRKAGVRRGGR